MLNKAIIMGRLTREPELKHTQGGVAVCTITLACERDFVGQDGRREADFIDVVCWRGTAELVARWFRKGLLVAAEGRLQSRRWADQYGQNRTNWEVVADSVYFAEKTERDSPSQPPAAQERPLSGPAGQLPPTRGKPSGAARGGRPLSVACGDSSPHRGSQGGTREDLRPVDPSRADIQADYAGDLYQLPESDFAEFDDEYGEEPF